MRRSICAIRWLKLQKQERTERRGNITKNKLKLGCLELREEVVDSYLVENEMIFN